MDRAAAIFEQALGDLATRMGVSRESLSAAELLALARAAERVANPFREVNADAAGMPVRVNDSVSFWPLTIGAIVWLEDTADVWWKDDLRNYRNALIYAVYNARDARAFEIISRRDVERKIRGSLRSIAATTVEIDIALDSILNGNRSDRTSDIESSSTSWANLIAELEAGTGITRDKWLWGESYRETLRTYHRMHTFARACSGKTSERMIDELDNAVNDLQRIKVDIMKRHEHV